MPFIVDGAVLYCYTHPHITMRLVDKTQRWVVPVRTALEDAPLDGGWEIAG